MGELISSSKGTRVRSVGGANANFPFTLVVTKHIFPRHLVLQCTVTNVGGGTGVDGSSNISGISFVVAESSDEMLSQISVVKIRNLPQNTSSSCYCVLSKLDRVVDSNIVLTCEVRYSSGGVESIGRGDTAEGSDLFGGVAGEREVTLSHVEEVDDVVISRSDLTRRN